MPLTGGGAEEYPLPPMLTLRANRLNNRNSNRLEAGRA